MGELAEITTWFTLPGWTRAHEIENIGSLGHIQIWLTSCGRDYRREDPEYDDRPIQAPPDMPRCRNCMRSPEARADGRARPGGTTEPTP